MSAQPNQEAVAEGKKMKRKKERFKRPLPSRSDAPLGARLALSNARRHLRIARVLGDERLFGSASAHVVLALEELAKSLMLTLIGMDIDVPRKMLADILSMHVVRHAMTFGILHVAMIRTLCYRAEVRVQKRHRVKDCPPELGDEFVKELKREFQLLSSRSRTKNPLFILLEMTAGANELKEQGLYVDFDGKNWNHPGRVSEKRFATAYEVAKSLMRGLGRNIVEIQNTGLKADETAKAIISNQIAKNQGASFEETLKNLTAFALVSHRE